MGVYVSKEVKIMDTTPITISIELHKKLVVLSNKTGKTVRELIEKAVLKGLGK